MTPHINAPEGAFAKTVLMPGDPLRAKYIAENFLDNPRLVTDVRNMLGYTGEYNGKTISVMGSGMGIPSISIYAKELITEYGVENIIRIGSCGAISDSIKLMDVVIAMGASTDSAVNRTRFANTDFAMIADYGLLRLATDAAEKQGANYHVGNLYSSDLFYCEDESRYDLMEKYGILGVEMEAAGLYGVAAEYGARALAMMTVTDHIRQGLHLTAEERQQTLNEMIKLTLEAVSHIE
ncbi:purine-nucleoside phosphorylase [Shewanella sp. 1_MG-2023]|uniref:purine-nucleoside phosphorylase n=1 Tax=unclassified Shewanella TaxID=196818 RepID=UPI000C83BEDE|nr:MULTISPECIES: purine-nucleoside phosphorylase [unclassified Shewanella]MDO6613200.1 purine-nucleoside phosphorylase [Shewanella sp. 7_MG-2023]MDO6773128.1 purine-nucleoside phosphorylase [Shewanella sp. 2_MG-2023]MDO6795604.1 purine-nucleoside phosphorylase [Shewanella sp. 1_MG-2023]PMG74918.1 purine-nucleoside phosphorylase [Shewanella sp. 10N.286.51.B7]